MAQSKDYEVVRAPRAGVNDDRMLVAEWLVEDGAKVEAQKAIAILETTKSTFDLESPVAGYVFRLVEAGSDVSVGAPVAMISATANRPRFSPKDLEEKEVSVSIGAENKDQVITTKARILMEQHGLTAAQFAGLAVVRADDVEKVLRQPASAPATPMFRGEPLDTNVDWDAACDSDLRRELAKLLDTMRRRMKAKYNRHVSTSNLLNDRWDLAKDHGFGEGTSVYDDCLILGDVKVGRNCWFGPGTILDGSGGLVVGDNVDVGAGSHLYSHNTIERALTGHKAAMFTKATRIGNCCFIAPQVIIAPGTVIRDHTFVAAKSYVEGDFPPFSYLAGSPAERVGWVELRGDRALIHHGCEPTKESKGSD